MTLHPQCRAVIEAAASGRSVFDTRDPIEARRRYDAATAIFAPPTPELDAVEDRGVPGPGGPVPVRFYRPRVADPGGPLPMLAFFHGGGWVFGGLESHDAVCRILAHEAGCLVASVDYRLAPEHRFPAALEDCLAATRWLAGHGASLGGDPARLAVGGDSAGGNLAAAVALAARDEGGPPLAFQLLVYPAVDFTADNDSLERNGSGYLLTRSVIDWTKEVYLRGPDDLADPRASPYLAKSLAGLPPALVQTAEYDPLLDEGRAYADRLAREGVAVEYLCYEGMVHGFVRMGAVIDDATRALGDAAARLRDAFGG